MGVGIVACGYFSGCILYYMIWTQSGDQILIILADSLKDIYTKYKWLGKQVSNMNYYDIVIEWLEIEIHENNAPINIMPHYPPPGRYRGQHRGIDIENQAPDRGIWLACIRYLSNPLSFPHPGRGIEWGFDRWGWPHLTGSWRVH